MSKITRTIFTTTFDVLAVDVAAEAVQHVSITVPGNVTDSKAALKSIIKDFSDDNIRPVAVKSCTVNGTLYGMDESKFIELATLTEKRGADTRGAVTKEVLSYRALCMVCDSSYNVGDASYMLPRKMDNETAKRWLNRNIKDGNTIVTVKSVNEVSGLYFLSLDRFIDNAEIMPDRTPAK